MGLSLRELLDKQRADREAKEKGGGAVESVPGNIATSTRTGHDVAVPQAASPSPAPAAPTPPPPKRSMFSSLSGAPANVTQTETPSPQTQVAAEAKPPNGQSHVVHGAGSGNSPSSPTLSADETENLRRNLAFLAANLDEKEIIGQVLRTTVRQIQQHPELNAIMIDSDFDLIVQAARRSMKFTARKKEDKADVKATKKSKKDELDSWLKDQGIEL